MPRNLPKDDVGDQFIQFRGPQTSVTHDGTGVRFTTEERGVETAHKPIPVVDDDADPADAPEGAVVRSVADFLTENNPLVCWGVACEVCGDVFKTLKGVNSHQSAHRDGSGADDGADVEAEEPDDDGEEPADDAGGE